MNDSKLEEIVINQTMDRSEVRKSKSKVRSYLKRCKDALYWHQNEEACTITVDENQPHSSNTSWYLTEIDSADSNGGGNKCNTELQTLQAVARPNHTDEQEAIDNEIKCTSMTMPPVEVSLNKV